MDFIKVKKYVVVGIKVLTFIASGISAYLGIKEITESGSPKKVAAIPVDDDDDDDTVVENSTTTSSSHQQTQEEKISSDVVMDDGLSQKGKKVLGILGVISSICLGIFEVIKSLGNVTDSVDRLFHRKRYSNRGYIPGNYPWNSPEQREYPNNTPIYRGEDGKQGGIYWIQREEGITEIW